MTDPEDAALAALLLGSDRPPRATFWCGHQEHKLGLIYELPGRGLVLALWQTTMLAAEVYAEVDPDDTQEVTWLPRLHRLAEDVDAVARCSCGTWSARTSVIRRKFEKGERDIRSHSRSWRQRLRSTP